MSQQKQRADFCCPSCDSSSIFLVADTDGTYQCVECDTKTHEKIEAKRDKLEGLAGRDDLKSALLAELLTEGDA